MAVQAGLPPNCQEIASRAKGTTGRDLVLRAADDAFVAGAQDVQVVVDGALLGQPPVTGPPRYPPATVPLPTYGDIDQMAIRVVARYDAAPMLPEAIVVLRGITA